MASPLPRSVHMHFFIAAAWQFILSEVEGSQALYLQINNHLKPDYQLAKTNLNRYLVILRALRDFVVQKITYVSQTLLLQFVNDL